MHEELCSVEFLLQVTQINLMFVNIWGMFVNKLDSMTLTSSGAEYLKIASDISEVFP